MKIEDYGKWTLILMHNGDEEWISGHIILEDTSKDKVYGFAHYLNGKLIKKFWEFGKLGFFVSEIQGTGIVNRKAISKLKVK